MNASEFIAEQLRHAGWAPIDQATAAFLNRDMAREHRDFTAWQQTPATLLRQFQRTALCRARVEGFGDVLILYRSSLVLAERIAFLTGGEVELIEDASLPAMAEPVRVVELLKRPQVDERLERLKALAGQEPPAHDCALRRDILAAQAELEHAT